MAVNYFLVSVSNFGCNARARKVYLTATSLIQPGVWAYLALIYLKEDAVLSGRLWQLHVTSDMPINMGHPTLKVCNERIIMLVNWKLVTCTCNMHVPVICTCISNVYEMFFPKSACLAAYCKNLVELTKRRHSGYPYFAE